MNEKATETVRNHMDEMEAKIMTCKAQLRLGTVRTLRSRRLPQLKAKLDIILRSRRLPQLKT
jgi:hypothetical protein